MSSSSSSSSSSAASKKPKTRAAAARESEEQGTGSEEDHIEEELVEPSEDEVYVDETRQQQKRHEEEQKRQEEEEKADRMREEEEDRVALEAERKRKEKRQVEKEEKERQRASHSVAGMIPLSVVAGMIAQRMNEERESIRKEVREEIIEQQKRQQQHGHHFHTSKAKMPDLEKLALFTGETDTDELNQWLRQVDRQTLYYMHDGRIGTEEDKLQFAIAYLSSGALDWWLSVRGEVDTFTTFREAIELRFTSEIAEDKAAEQIYESKQKDGQSVTKYTDRYQRLLLRVPDMAITDRIRHFVRGLREPIQSKIKEKGPKTVEEAIQLAIKLEGLAPKTGTTGLSGAKSSGHDGAGLNSVGETTGGHEPNQVEKQMKEMRETIATLQRKPWNRTSATATPRPFCVECGDPTHTTASCKLDEFVCFNCRKPGRIKVDCKAPKGAWRSTPK